MVIASKITLLSLALPFILQGCFGGGGTDCDAQNARSGFVPGERCVELSRASNGRKCLDCVVACNGTAQVLTLTKKDDEEEKQNACMLDCPLEDCPWGEYTGTGASYLWGNLLTQPFSNKRENVFCYKVPTPTDCPQCDCLLNCTALHRTDTTEACFVEQKCFKSTQAESKRVEADFLMAMQDGMKAIIDKHKAEKEAKRQEQLEAQMIKRQEEHAAQQAILEQEKTIINAGGQSPQQDDKSILEHAEDFGDASYGIVKKTTKQFREAIR